MSNDFGLDYGDEAVYEINGQEMTADQLVESYQNLQKEYTKVTQKNSEFSKNSENVKQWLDWDSSLDQLSKETGLDVKSLAGSQINGLIQSIVQGKNPTGAQAQQLENAIGKAERKGDDATAQKLQQLESYMSEQILTNTINDIFEGFSKEGYDVNPDDFEKFADEWLEDLGVGEDDDFDPKLLKKAAQAYEATLLKENSRRRIPQLGTSGGASSPSRGKDPDKVGGIKGASAKAAEYLNTLFR
jgi:hypothetical protein